MTVNKNARCLPVHLNLLWPRDAEAVVKSQLRPPLPIIEEEDAPEITSTSRDEAKTPADTEITPEAFVGALNEINDDKIENSEEFFYPDDSEEVLENPQEVLTKIANLCDSLINGQENCVSWIKSEDSVNSQTEELVETLEGLQSELRIYKDLLMEDTGHAPAMKSIVDSMRPDIERMSNESYGMTYAGILPKHGEQICSVFRRPMGNYGGIVRPAR